MHTGKVFDARVFEGSSGYTELVLEGAPGPIERLKLEAGGHRWQRVPPNEKRGRTQTSTVTIAVMPMPDVPQFRLKESDIEEHTCRASGAGGQHVQKTDSSILLRHRPTGIEVRCQDERSQHRNRALARQVLEARVQAATEARIRSAEDASRRSQIGSGMRGDKVRTYQVKYQSVSDHRTGAKFRLARIMDGFLDG